MGRFANAFGARDLITACGQRVDYQSFPTMVTLRCTTADHEVVGIIDDVSEQPRGTPWSCKKSDARSCL